MYSILKVECAFFRKNAVGVLCDMHNELSLCEIIQLKDPGPLTGHLVDGNGRNLDLDSRRGLGVGEFTRVPQQRDGGLGGGGHRPQGQGVPLRPVQDGGVDRVTRR